MLELILVAAIFILSLINLLRIALYMLGADWHDVRRHRANAKSSGSHRDPVISIIVPAYNEALVIARCLESIYANPYRNKEVIVVNDGSTDHTYNEVWRFKYKRHLKNLKILFQTNSGKAAAINRGISKARGSLVMVLDADSYLESNALGEAVRYFDDPRVVMTAGNIKIIDDGSWLGLIQKFEYLISYRMKRAQTTYNIEYIIGGIASTFRKKTALAVGCYDSDTVTEDIDFTMKILRAGNINQRVIYAPSVIAYTESVMSFRQLIRQRFRWKYGRMQTFVKNYRMFFSRNGRYDKRLTMIQLPFALFGEFTFLFEPVVIGFLAYIIVRYGDLATLLSAYLVTTVYVALNIIAEQTESVRAKFKLLLLTPFQYPLFFVLSAVEYIVLIQSITKVRELVSGAGDNRWEHVPRAGKSVAF